MSAAEPKGGDPRFDLSLLAAVHAALVSRVAALEVEGDPSHDADLEAPMGDDHIRHHEGCDCADCFLFVAEIDVIVAEHRDASMQHQEERACLAPYEDVTFYPDPCPYALMARSGVAERGARYARTPAAPAAAPSAARPRFVPVPPTRRHAEVFA